MLVTPRSTSSTGRIVFEREADDLADVAGSLTGAYEQNEISILRSEWD